MKKTFSIVIFFLFTFNVIAQNTNRIDSLLKVLKKNIDDTTRVNVLNQLSWNYINSDFDNSLKYGEQALDLAQKIDFNSGIGLAYTYISYAYYRKGSFDDALIYVNKAIAVYEVLNDYKKISKSKLTISQIYYAQAKYSDAIEYAEQALQEMESLGDSSSLELNYLTLGVIYKDKGDYVKALENFFISIDYCNKNHNSNTLGSNYNNIAVVYRLQEKYDKALEFYNEALKLYQQTQNKIGESQALNNIAVVYEAQKSFDLALEYYKKAYNIFIQINYLQGQATSLLNISGIEINLNKLENVEKRLTQAEKIALQINDNFKLVSIYGLLGQYYLKINNVPTAIKYTQKAYDIANKIDALGFISDMALQLSLLYEKEGQYNFALEYYKKYTMFSDSIFNIKKTELIESLNQNFNAQQKEKELELKRKEIEILEKDNRISNFKIYVLFSIILFLLTIFFYAFINYKRKVKAEKTLRENEIAIKESQNKIMELEIKNNDIKSEVLKNQIEYKNKEIQNFAFHIIDKNDFILNIQNKLKEARKNLNSLNAKQELQKLITMINAKMLLERDREEFLAYINQINDNFYYKLNQKYPDLTEGEIRIASLLRIGFSSKEISSILHITPKSVDTNRYRIRKKLNIDSTENLNEFFKNI